MNCLTGLNGFYYFMTSVKIVGVGLLIGILGASEVSFRFYSLDFFTYKDILIHSFASVISSQNFTYNLYQINFFFLKLQSFHFIFQLTHQELLLFVVLIVNIDSSKV